MKIILTITVCFIVICFSTAQTNTVNENWCGTSGSLTTNTIIHEGNRVYHGPYSYIGHRSPQEGYSKGTMSIKGTRKYGKMDGDFLMTYVGGHFTGELDYKLEGKLAEKVMIGTWKIKSKCRNIDAYNNEKYTYDKNFTLTFDNNGQIISGTRINNASGSIIKFQTDDKGYLHGNQISKYDDSGYLVEEIENYFHGILISKYKKDVKSGLLLGKIEVYADSSLVNEKNYLKNENAIINLKYNNLFNSVQNLKDTLNSTNLQLDNLKKSNDFVAFNETLINEKKVVDSLKQLEIKIIDINSKIEKYKINKYSIDLYNYLKDKSLLSYDDKTKKSLDKVISNFIANGQINTEDKYHFLKSSLETILIKINSEGAFSEVTLDKKSHSIIQKLSNESKFTESENKSNIIFELTGLDEDFFNYNKNLKSSNEEKNNLTLNQKNILEEKNKLSIINDKIKSLENQLTILKEKLSQSEKTLAYEKKYYEIVRKGIAYEYMFKDNNEMGGLLSCLEIKFDFSSPILGKLE